METIIDDSNCHGVLLYGDWNTDIFNGLAWSHLENFIEGNNLMCLDYWMLHPDTYTNINHSHSQCTWLDHVIGRTSPLIPVNDIKVLAELIGSDHFPIYPSLHLTLKPIKNDILLPKNYKFIDWNSFFKEELTQITIEATALQGDMAADIQLHNV